MDDGGPRTPERRPADLFWPQRATSVDSATRPVRPPREPATQPVPRISPRPPQDRLPHEDPSADVGPRTGDPGRTAVPRGTARRATAQSRSRTPGARPDGHPAAPATTTDPRTTTGRTPTAAAAWSAATTGYARRSRRLGPALLTTAAATFAPGLGHLILYRRRTGTAILTTYVLGIVALTVLAFTIPREDLLEGALSTRVLAAAVAGLVLTGAVWITVIVRTYLLARPRRLAGGQRLIGAAVVSALCMLVAAPLGYGANLANSQRNLLDALFPGGGSGADLIAQPRVNILLLGSDAAPDRTGTRTDTMMVASIDTRTGRTILFGLPRNIAYAQFPPGSAAAEEFPRGFHDGDNRDSGDYLLNAVYAYGTMFPELAPPGPSTEPGLNLLTSSIGHMLGLPVDYFIEVDMSGFAALIDALGGLRIDVGPERIPIGGISATGRSIRPEGYIEPGSRQLDGATALDFARSRTDSTDYVRMGRQRCLIQTILEQKSPADLLTNFRSIARATVDSVATNIPQNVLPALASLADEIGSVPLESLSFDPNLPDPDEDNGRFNTGRPNFPYMREVVRDAIAGPPAPATSPTAAPAAGSARTTDAEGTGATEADPGTGTDARPDADATSAPDPPGAAPTSIAQSC